MRVVVTGGAGFLGSRLIEALEARGDEVVCIEQPGLTQPPIAKCCARYADVGLTDVERLRELFTGAQTVFHLAGLLTARGAREYYAVNTEGTHAVLEAAAGLGRAAPRVILASSTAALGPCRNGEPLSPDTVPHPLSQYGYSKLLAEAVAHAYGDRVPVTILRFSSIYGPRDQSLVGVFRMIGMGVAVSIGSWDRTASLLYVDDAVQALVAAADSPAAAGRTYCITHPDPVTWRAFAQALGRTVGRPPVLVSVPATIARGLALGIEAWARLRRRSALLGRDRVREVAASGWVADPSRATREFGFRPAYPLDRGLAETLAWYRRARWV
jgi:nucleoside-diphosphate-sugar epimerase